MAAICPILKAKFGFIFNCLLEMKLQFGLFLMSKKWYIFRACVGKILAKHVL